MAVGYEKINTSAARSRRVAKREIDASSIVVTPKNTNISHPIYGEGVTSESFVSDADVVSCVFVSGHTVALRGGAIRALRAKI